MYITGNPQRLGMRHGKDGVANMSHQLDLLKHAAIVARDARQKEAACTLNDYIFALTLSMVSSTFSKLPQ